MVYIDEEERLRQLAERKAIASEYQAKREALLRQNEELNAAKKAAEEAQKQSASALTAGAGKNSMTAAKVNESLAGYQHSGRVGDNDMAKVVANYGKERPEIAGMTYEQAMGFATRIVYDDERDDFLKRWQKAHKDISPTMDEMRAYLNKQKPGGVYQAAGEAYSKQIQENFKNEYASKKLLHTFDGLTDVAGNAINMNTASLQDVERAIRFTASEKKRSTMVDALDTLTKTPGNRFYGAKIDKSLTGKFLESSALSEDDYNAKVEYFRKAFDPIAGAGEANTAAYAELLRGIEQSDKTDYVKRQFKDALNEAYTELIGGELPELTNRKPDEPEKSADDAGESQTEDEPMPKGGAVWNAQGEAYTIADGKAVKVTPDAAPEPIAPSAPTLKEALGDERFMKRYIEKVQAESGEDAAEWTEETLRSIFKQGVETGDYERFVDELMASSVRVASAGDLTGVLSGAKKNALPEIGEDEEKPKETYGPARPSVVDEMSHSFWQALRDEAFYGEYTSAAEKQDEIPYGSVDLTHDPVKAAVYAHGNEATKLTRETQDALADLVQSSPGLRAVFKTAIDPTQDQRNAAQGGDIYARAFVDATRSYWATGDASAILGSTLGYYLNLSDSDRYEPEMQVLMKGALSEIVVAAEDAYARGEYSYDPSKETLYDAYLRYNPAATTQIRGAVRTLDEMDKEARRQAMLAVESDERNRQEQLRLDQEAVRSGTYSQEQYDNVLASAPVVTVQNARTDSTYNAMVQEIAMDRTLADGMDDSWHNAMAERYLRENGLPEDIDSVAAMQYKDALAEFEKDVLLGDMRIAQMLGYPDLGEMYAKWGGMDVERMHLRAEAAMARMEQSVTQEDVEILEQAQKVYTGDGNVSSLNAFGAGVAHGALDTSSEMLEGIWALGTLAKEDMPAAVYKVRTAWYGRYNEAIAGTMYKKAMYEYCDLVPEEYGDSIRKYLDAGYDPFRLGIDPTQESVVLNASKALDGRAKAIGRWAERTLDKEKGQWFEHGSTTGSQTVMVAVDMFTQGITGSPLMGSLLGYGVIGAGQQMKEELAAGRDRKGALVMGLARAVSDTTANMLTNGQFYERALGFIGYTPAVALGAGSSGKVSAARGAAAMIQRFKDSAMIAGLKGAAQTFGEEMFVDEFSEDVAWQLIGGATEAVLDGATVIKAAADSLLGMDVVGAAAKTIANLDANFVATLPMAVFGGIGSTFRKNIENMAMRNSVRAASEVMATGTTEAAEKFVQALASDLEDPANRDSLNQALHDAAVGQETVVIAMTDEEAGKDIDVAAKAQEQADAHTAEQTSSEKRMEAAQAAYYERKESGDIDGANKALANYTKANQGRNEHEREKDQKQQEADEAFAKGMQTAVSKAEAEVSAREAEIANPTPPDQEVDPAYNARVMEAEEFIAQRYPGGVTDAQREEIYAGFMADEDMPVSGEAEAPQAKEQKANASFAAQVARKFGVNIRFGSLDGAQGAYSRDSDTITLDANTTQGDVIRSVMIHELMHRAETSGEYAELSDALLALKYGDDSAQLDADVRSIMGRYESYYAQQGRQGAFTEADARREIVADAAAEVIGGNEELINRLVAERPSIARRIINAIKSVIDRLRGVRDPEMENLRRVEALFEKAIRTSGEGRGEQYSLVDVGEMGKGVYESNFDASVSRDEKKNRLIELWQNVWSQKPIELNIVEDGKTRTITASFDPDYDITNVRKTDLGKVMTSRNGSGGDRTVTLNLADDLYDLARTSDFLTSEDETGKTTSTHQGVKKWHYFFNDIIYRDESGTDTPYTVWLDVKEKDEGGYVYQLYARKTKKRTAQSQPSDISRSALTMPSPSDTSVPENAPDVNTQSMQNRQFSLPSQSLLRQEIAAWRGARQSEAQQEEARRQGERQFVKKTLQSSRAMPSYIRQTLFNDPNSRYYEMDSNDEQIIRAYQTIQQEGKEAAIERILTSREMPTKDEIAQANVLMAQAAHDGDMNTLLALSRHYAEDTTEIAQALQAMKIFKRMTPAGAMQAAAAQNEALLAGYIQGHEPMRKEAEDAARSVESSISQKDGRDPIALLGSGETVITRENSEWGIPINERQEALIRHYKLENERRPGIYYNRATLKQRMLEAILATPDPLEATGEGMTLVTRLEYMKKGAPVITNADLEYIGHQLSIYMAMDADSQEERAGQLALARAYEANANITQAGVVEKINGARYIGMLMNATSPMRNVMGNVLQTGVNTLSDSLATAIDGIVSLATKTHTKASLTPKEMIEGWEAFRQETVDTFRDYFVDQAIVKQGEGRFDVNRRGRIYQSKAAETARLVESFVMSVGDRNFWKMAYVNSMNEQMRVAQKNGVPLDYEAARVRAEKDANYATFNEDNKVRDAMNALKNAGVFGKAIDLLMPFTGVPTNIVKRQLEYGPVGLLYTCVKHGVRAAAKQTFDQRAFVEEMARGLTGTGLMVLGFALKELGMIHGGTGEEEDTQAYYMRTAKGDQYTPYITVGDQNVSLSTFAPAVSPILMGAAVYDALEGDVGMMTALASGVSASLDSIIDASYFSALQDIIKGEGKFFDKAGQALLTSAATQSTPSILAHVASATDPYVRDTKDKDWLKQTLNKAMARIPGLRQTLPIKYDVTGEAVMNTKAGWRALLDPLTTTEAEDDPAIDEMMALYERTGEASGLTGYLISSNSYKLSVTQKASKAAGTGSEGYTMELTTEQKQAINQKYADILFNGVGGIRSLINSRRWQTMSDEERVDEIADMRSDAKLEATVWAIREYGW